MSTPANTVYLDCFSGISGDMLLGALINAGLSPDLLQREFAKLDLDPFDFSIVEKKVQSIAATSVSVRSKSKQSFKNLTNIKEILKESQLNETVIKTTLDIFTRLAQAEAQVHGKPVDEIHFHEVGALDTIIDIVGTVAGFNLLGISKIFCSPLPLGRGFVRCAHGNLPLPAPAVCNLLKDVPAYGIEAQQELVTPTGAALAVCLTDNFGTMPPMTIKSIGYGAGEHEGSEDRPNLLRVITGHMETVEEAQQVDVIETNLDDWSPEGFPFLCERLFAHQALDVSLMPIHMKKGRPGFCLQVITHPQHSQLLKDLILSETTAIGLRFRREQRMTLPREVIEVDTPWGAVIAKKIITPNGSPTIYPEYEACRIVAEKHSLPLDRVYREILIKSQENL